MIRESDSGLDRERKSRLKNVYNFWLRKSYQNFTPRLQPKHLQHRRTVPCSALLLYNAIATMRLLLLCVFVANVVFAATLPTGTMDDALGPGTDDNGTDSTITNLKFSSPNTTDALETGTDVNGTMDDALGPGTDVNGTMDDALEPGTDVNGTDSTVTNLKFSSPSTDAAIFTSSPGNKRIKRDDADNTKAKDTCTSNGGANCQTGVVAILTERNGLAKQLEDNKKLQEAMKVEFASYASGKIVTVALLAVFMVIFILLLAAVLVDAFVFNKLFQRATSSASV